MFSKSIYSTLFPYLEKKPQQPFMAPPQVEGDPQIQTPGGPVQEPATGQGDGGRYRDFMDNATEADLPGHSGRDGIAPINFNPANLASVWDGDQMEMGGSGGGRMVDDGSQVLSSTMERSAMKDAPTPRPTFTGTPTEIQLQDAQYDAAHAEDRNKGFKSRMKEVLSNFLYGMSQAPAGTDWKAALALGGIGAAGGAVKRNWNEQREAQQEVPVLRQRAQFEAAQRMQSAQTRNLELQPEQKRVEHERKIKKDEIASKYNNDRIRFGQARADDIRYWREQQLELEEQKIGLRDRELDQKDEQIEQVDRKIEELIRSNKAGEGQSALNEQGRNARFGVGQQNTMKRANITSADRARATLAAIEKKAPEGSTPEQIEAKKQEFLRSLTPEVRKSLGQP